MTIEEIKLNPIVVYGLQKGVMIPIAQVTYKNPEDREGIIQEIFDKLVQASQDGGWCQFGPTLIFSNAYDAFKVV
jgi:hypothetical protein